MSIFIHKSLVTSINYPKWKREPAPNLATCQQASAWWRGLEQTEKGTIKAREGLVSLVDIAKYWVLNVKDKS